jgi:hypothetical protein
MYQLIPENESKRKIARKLRDEALAKNEEFYFTGNPCKRNHVTNRRAKDAACMGCVATHRKENAQAWFIKSRYKFTIEEYRAMLLKQGNVCAICNKEETARNSVGGIRTLSVDRCHDTGKVRGLLCSGCNTSIGSARRSL